MANHETIFALLVNPRNGEPLYAELSADREDVTIRTLDDTERGTGTFHDYGAKYSLSERITELPRAHTPDGVTEKGTGLGTVLYGALCAAAHREYEGKLRVKVGISGNGISSNEHRSKFASEWWKNARERYGLAERVKGCAEDEFEDTYGVSESEAEGIVASSMGIDPDELHLTNWDERIGASGTADRCGIEADALRYARVEHHGIVLAFIDPGVAMWSEVTEEDIDSAESLDGILAVNLGVLHDRTRYTAAEASAIAESLIGIAGNDGATERQLDAMRARYALGLDIDDAATWAHPDFTAYLPEGVRQNPSKSRRVRTSEGAIVTTTQAPRLARPRVVPTPVPKFYGTRRNPAPDRDEVAAELKRLQAARVKLGWGVYAAQKRAP